MKRYLLLTAILALLWIPVNGASLTAISLGRHLLTGIIIGIPLAYLLRRFYQPEMDGTIVAYSWTLIRYLGSFIYEVIASNIDTAYRVLHPSMPINPAIIDVQINMDHPTAVAIIANSITLTPGTLVIDHLEDENALRIHCLNFTNEDDVKQTIQKYENHLEPLFGDTA